MIESTPRLAPETTALDNSTKVSWPKSNIFIILSHDAVYEEYAEHYINGLNNESWNEHCFFVLF